ncbi:MAG TPA: PKD domain-containing protein [Thermoplasmata archaeon]|nr:PKD domain-containing protein [Thermoplasmata archaeon]
MHPLRGRGIFTGPALTLVLLSAGSGLVGPSSVHAAVSPVGALTLGPRATGSGSASPGAAVSASTEPATPSSVRPAAGVSLGWDGADPTGISLNWTSPGDLFFQYYTLYSSTTSGNGPWQTVLVITPQTNLTAWVSGLAPGATYWWQVNETGSVGSNSSNVLQETQPTLAYLNYTQPTASTVKLTWTNNASYGGLVSFVSYTVYEELNGGAATPVLTVNAVGTRSATLTISTGSYLYYVTTDDCLGCGSSPSTNVATNSNPVTAGGSAPLGNSLTVNKLVVDVGQADLFACTPSGGKSPYRFSWDYGSGTFLAGTATESHTFATAGNTTVTCHVTDALAGQANASVTIQVDPEPVLTVLLNRTSIDVGQSIAFSCTVANGTAPFQVGWLFGDGNAVAVGVVTHTYSATGSVVATCQVTDGTGTQELLTAAVTVDAAPSVVASVNYAAAAPGYTLTFSGTATNGSGSYLTYLWSFGDGNQSSGSSTTHAYGAPGNFTVTLRVTDSHGVTSRGTVAVGIAAIGADLSSYARSITTGNSITFIAAAFGGAGGPYNYTWKFGDGAAGYGARVTHRFTSTGTLHPSLKVTDRLGSSATVAVAGLSVAATPNPYAWLTPWLLVLFAIVVGLLVGVIIYRRHRRAEIAALPAMPGWVPTVDPNQTMSGMKVCGFCGKANVPLRTTCEACGKPLRRFGRA